MLSSVIPMPASYRVEPQIPCDKKTGEVSEECFGPLIETCFERLPAVELDDDDRKWDVEGDGSFEPEDEVRVAEFCCCAEIRESGDEEDFV